MRTIRIQVGRDGKVQLVTEGFQGTACVEEVERLIQRLKELGIEAKTTDFSPTAEYYASQQTQQQQKQTL